MERRELDFTDFDALVMDVEQLRQRGYTKVGNWELCQICDHLAAAMRCSLDGAPFRAPWLIRKVLAPIFLKKIMKNRKMRTGIKGPAPLMPGAPGDLDASIHEFKLTLARLREHPGEFHLHPFFEELAPEQNRQFHLIHAAHHLSFLVPNA